jgi:hypothetical protein
MHGPLFDEGVTNSTYTLYNIFPMKNNITRRWCLPVQLIPLYSYSELFLCLYEMPETRKHLQYGRYMCALYIKTSIYVALIN